MAAININNIADEIRKINHLEIDKLCDFIYEIKVCWGNYKNDDYLPKLFDILSNMPIAILLKVANIIIDVNNQELDYFLIRILNEDKRISKWINSYRIGNRPQHIIDFRKKLLSSEGIKQAIAELGCEGLEEMLAEHYDKQKNLNPNDYRRNKKLQRRMECILK